MAIAGVEQSVGISCGRIRVRATSDRHRLPRKSVEFSRLLGCNKILVVLMIAVSDSVCFRNFVVDEEKSMV